MPITDAERESVIGDLVTHTPRDYRIRALERAADILEKHVADFSPGYHKHWTLVDAAVLREEATKMKESQI